MNVSVARKYAASLFEQAKTKGLLDQVQTDLHKVEQVLKEEPKVLLFLQDPKVEVTQKKWVISELLQSMGMCDDVKAFVYIVIARQRIQLFSEMVGQFVGLKHKHEGVLDGEITITSTVGEDVIQEVRQAFETWLNAKIVWTNKVDNELMAGFKVKINDTVYDASMQAQLQNLNAKLDQVI